MTRTSYPHRDKRCHLCDDRHMGTVAATPFQAETILDTLQTVMTHDPESARDTISRLFVPHDLQPLERPRRLAFELRSAQQDDVGLNLLDYGTAVRISAEPLSSFVLVQIPLSGHALVHFSLSVE